MSQRFLISRLSSLGDVVCTLPVAGCLKRGDPSCEVTWVVDRRFADVVRCCTAVDEVIERREFQGGKFDVALDVQGLLKSALIVGRCSAKRKLGYHWQREGSALFSQRVLPDASSLHVVDQYVDVARAAGGESDQAEFNFRARQQDLDSIGPKLPPSFVAVNPGGAWASKRWPAERFAEMIDALPIPCVLLGSKGETMGEEVAKRCKRPPIDLTGQTTIGELIALIGLSRAHVGGDTGSSHIAAALGVPAIGIYSATRPERSCPYGQILRCHYDSQGLDRISSAEVVKSVEAVI